jgi:hypothetical protein
MSGVDRIRDERERHLVEERFSDLFDDRYHHGELALAAVCYATPPRFRQEVPMKSGPYGEGYESCSVREAEFTLPELWPFPPTDWRPSGGTGTEDRIRELVKAGSLIAAEIDRLERLGKR